MTTTKIWATVSDVSSDDPFEVRALGGTTTAIVAEIRRRMRHRDNDLPLLVAFDGPSGSGKSTLAALVAGELGATVVPSDDFFAAEITDTGWDALSPRARAEAAIDWRRLREQALVPLLAGKVASWHPFDFAAGTRPDGTYPMAPDLVTRTPSAVILVEGAYSSRSELADLIEFAVLVDLPSAERHRRLATRDDKAFSDAWHARWDAAEDYYFTEARPPSWFDLVVTMPLGAP
ncbi:MAG: (d)CMP kinase [Actinomycetota bacterium]|nr:(d)CMP kinase [Actinomycetota bacterium]